MSDNINNLLAAKKQKELGKEKAVEGKDGRDEKEKVLVMPYIILNLLL